MPKAPVPAAREAVTLLQDALAAGHAVTISLAAPPRVDRTPALVAACCLTFRLTQAEARILVALAEHGYGAKEDLLAAMSPHGQPKIDTLGVAICRLRQKLKSHDIAVETVWGQGYKLNENARARVRARLAAASEAE
jgi:hypothetical protein